MIKMTEISSIYRNQLELFDPDQFDHYPISIIGCGSIGSFIALTLAKMGFKKLFLYDDDNIENHNIPTQFFRRVYVGYNKAHQTLKMIKKMSECKGVSFPIKYKKQFPLFSPIVIASTDNMKSRKEIYQGCKKYGVRLLIDSRMGGEAFTVFTVDMTNKESMKRYKKTFHKDTRMRCTVKGIIYNVLMISSVIASQLVKVLQNVDYCFEVNGDSRNLIFDKNK